MSRSPLLAVCALIVLAFSVPHEELHANLPPRYTVVNLGSLGGSDSAAHGVNERGQVAGWSRLPGDQSSRAVLWTDAFPQSLEAFGGDTNAFGINSAGQVAGVFRFDSDSRAVVWIGSTEVLPAPPGWGDLVALGINTRGDVVGEGTISGERHAVMWTDGDLVDLGGPGAAFAVNDRRQVVISVDDSGHSHIARWTDGVLELLPLGQGANALDINNRGQIAGGATDATGRLFAVRWTGATVEDLGAGWSDAYGINDRGWVVGQMQVEDGLLDQVAMLYDGNTAYDLNELIIGYNPFSVVFEARDINNRGEIAGTALVSGTSNRSAVLLRPVRADIRR